MTAEQTAGTDLHTRIREALEERIRLAKAATEGPWRLSADGLAVYDIADLSFDHGIRQEEVPQAKANARYMVANGPDVEIRRAEAGLRTLDRHAVRMNTYVLATGDLTVTECRYCDVEHPCPEVRELAAGEGIQP